MERVAVVGPGGAGKSAFSVELAERAGLPLVHLDRHFWRPGWVRTPRGEWRALQETLFSDPNWIADGNYQGTYDIRLRRADTLVILALPRFSCVAGALRRLLKNWGQAVQAEGCPERFDVDYLRWIWRYPDEGRSRLDAAIAEHGKHLHIVELRSRSEAKAFLVGLTSPQ